MDKYTTSCGVIPISEHNGKIYVLCGKEKKNDEYTGFGGGRKKYENIEQAASRECYEETVGLLGNQREILQSIHNKKVREIDIIIEYGTNKTDHPNINHVYKSYWVEFPYYPDINKVYRNVNEYIKHCSQSKDRYYQNKNRYQKQDQNQNKCFSNSCFEKTELKYFKLEDIYKTAKQYKKNNKNNLLINGKNIYFSKYFLIEVNELVEKYYINDRFRRNPFECEETNSLIEDTK